LPQNFLAVKINLLRAREVKRLDKDKLVNAANDIYNGADVGKYHDEIETIIALIMHSSNEDIAAAWDEISNDADI